MEVPSAVLGVVLLELAVGGLVVLWLAPTWGAVRHGYELLLGGSLALFAFGGWASLRAPLAASGSAAWTGRALLLAASLAAASTLLLAFRVATVARLVGAASAVGGTVALVAVALVRGASLPGGVVQGVAEVMLGAFFLGAVWDAMILGHWYLVERRLSNRYFVWMAWVNVGAVVAGLVSVLLSARNPVPCHGLTGARAEACLGTFSPLLSVGSITVTMGLGLVGLVGMTAGFNVKLAREGGRSIQAATGMSYLAVIMAPAAEFAAKLRYF